MNVAIVGSSGYIAGYLIMKLESKSYIGRILKIDCTDDSEVYLDLQAAEKFDYAVLNDIDYIIFTAAISGPDKCALDFEFCWQINVIGTIYFIEEAIKRRCRVLFFSSDAVFGNIPGAIYTESSKTKAITPYGRMKKAVEDWFESEELFKAIRLSYVVSIKDRFVSYCLDCISKEKIAEVYHPYYRNCIVVNDVVDVALWFAEHWDEYPERALNVAGKELISRIRIADELNRHLEKKLKYTISYPGEGFYQSRHEITQMKSIYMQQYMILEDCTFTEKISKELEDVRNEH